MKFKYKKFRLISPSAFSDQKYLLRPIIPLTIIYKDKKIGYEALIDSGADFCIFHAEVGEFLEIPIKKGERGNFGGIVGSEAKAYVHEVNIIIGENRFGPILVGFSYDITPHGYGILGHHGFFSIFRIMFDLKKEQIELRLKR